MSGLLFGQDEIEGIRQRAARHGWASRSLERIRRGLEFQREDLLTGGKRALKGEAPGRTFLELALCARLEGGWHREAVEMVLREAADPAPFMFKQAFELCLGLDFAGDVDNALRERIIQRILLPVGERFVRERFGGSNIQTTYNLTLLNIGLLTSRSDFIDRVTSDPERGFAYHLANSVRPDGFWYEQSHASYHIGTIERLMLTRWIAERNGLGLGGDEVIRKMVDTLPGMAMQGGVLPLIGEIKGDGRPTLYRPCLLEVAYARYETPWIGWALGRMDREDLWSLLVGRDIGRAEAPDHKSRLYPETGLCVLKNGEPETYWDGKGSGVTLSFGPHGDWHGHAGKLGIEYRRDSQYQVRDLGNSGSYSQPIHRMWYMTTLAHSTLVLDGRNQAFTWTKSQPQLESRESGICQSHLFRDEVSACTASADFAFPGCRVSRTLFLTSGYLLDIMECDSLDGGEHTFDWVLHTGGMIQTGLPFARAPLDYAGERPALAPPAVYSCNTSAPSPYDYIREVEALRTGDAWSLDVMDCVWAADFWKIKGKAMGLAMLGEAGTTVFKGVCPVAAQDVYDPVILVRRRTRRTVFIALHVPGDRKMDLECLKNEGGTLVCRVSENGVGTDLLVKRDSDESAELCGMRVDGKLAFSRTTPEGGRKPE